MTGATHMIAAARIYDRCSNASRSYKYTNGAKIRGWCYKCINSAKNILRSYNRTSSDEMCWWYYKCINSAKMSWWCFKYINRPKTS